MINAKFTKYKTSYNPHYFLQKIAIMKEHFMGYKHPCYFTALPLISASLVILTYIDIY